MILAKYTPDEKFLAIKQHVAIVSNDAKILVALFGDLEHDPSAVRDAARFLACFEAMKTIPTNKIDEAGKMARAMFGLTVGA